MRQSTLIPLRFAVLVVFGCVLAAGRLLADDPAGEDVLRAKGLARRGSTFCLRAELELNKALAGPRSESMKMKKAVDEAQAALAAAQTKAEDFEKKVRQWRQMYDQLNVQHASMSPTSPQANRMVQQINQLVALINAAPTQMEEADLALKALRKTAAARREEFVQYVLNLRRQHSELETRYQQLAADPEIKKALEVSGQAGKKLALGPMKSTTDALRKLEGAVITDAVPIHFGLSRIWLIFVSFNEQPPQEMGIDTGASVTVLPHKMARAVGLYPGADSPRITLTLADGQTTIEAALVTAKTMRVGRFSVKNVKCAVLPENLEKAEPLLGMSFLSHFSFKVDKEQNKLVLSSVGGPRDSKGGSGTTLSAAAPETAPAEKPLEAKATTMAEQLAKLLTLPADEPGQSQEMRTTGPNGKPLVFRPSRRGPAKTLQDRFGDPDEIRKIPSPAPSEDGQQSPPWKVWIWGRVLVLVDESGTTRYFGTMEE